MQRAYSVLFQKLLMHDVSYIVGFKIEVGKRKNRNKPKGEEMSFWNLAALQLEELMKPILQPQVNFMVGRPLIMRSSFWIYR